MSELAEEKRLASIKQAEVLSVVGAGVLGAGLALLAPAALGPYVYWLIGVGVAVHGLGMTMKHRLERERRVAARSRRRAVCGAPCPRGGLPEGSPRSTDPAAAA